MTKLITILWASAGWLFMQYVTSMDFVKIGNFRLIGLVVLIFYACKSSNKNIKLINVSFSIFVISFAVVMLYPWLPDNIKLIEHTQVMPLYYFCLYIYFISWTAYSLGLMFILLGKRIINNLA